MFAEATSCTHGLTVAFSGLCAGPGSILLIEVRYVIIYLTQGHNHSILFL